MLYLIINKKHMKEFEDNLGMFIDDEEWEREMGR